MYRTIRALVMALAAALVIFSLGCSNQETIAVKTNDSVSTDKYEFSIESCNQCKNTGKETQQYEIWKPEDDRIYLNSTIYVPPDCTMFALRGTFKNNCNYDLDLSQIFRGSASLGGTIEEPAIIYAAAENDFVAPQESKEFVISFTTTTANAKKLSPVKYKFGFVIDKAFARLDELPTVYICTFQ